MKNMHAYFSPSGAEKWMKCAASLAMEIKYFTEKKSLYATEGTIAHKLAERLLNYYQKIHRSKYSKYYINNKILLDSDKRDIFNILQINDDMSYYVQKYVDCVWNFSLGKKLFIEQQVDFSEILNIPNQFGTADAIILNKDELQIHDLKYGFSKVTAYQNKQLQLYALGFLSSFKKSKTENIKKIYLFIHQPRLKRISKWYLNIEDLFFFGQKVKSAAQKAFLSIKFARLKGINNLPFNMFKPGFKQCKWCKVSGGYCKAETNFYLNMVTGKLNDISTFSENLSSFEKDSKKYQKILSLKDLAFLYKNLNFFLRFVSSVRSRVSNELKRGKIVPGVKIITAKSGSRVWSDVQKVYQLFRLFSIHKQDYFLKKLITPAQAEKILKNKYPILWKKLQNLITQNEVKRVSVLNSVEF